jgi:hypothetical protein
VEYAGAHGLIQVNGVGVMPRRFILNLGDSVKLVGQFVFVVEEPNPLHA